MSLSKVYTNQFNVINKGITKYTCYDGLVLADSIIIDYPNIALTIIYLGGNDAASYSNVTIPVYYKNMKEMALKMNAVGKVILITPCISISLLMALWNANTSSSPLNIEDFNPSTPNFKSSNNNLSECRTSCGSNSPASNI